MIFKIGKGIVGNNWSYKHALQTRANWEKYIQISLFLVTAMIMFSCTNSKKNDLEIDDTLYPRVIKCYNKNKDVGINVFKPPKYIGNKLDMNDTIDIVDSVQLSVVYNKAKKQYLSFKASIEDPLFWGNLRNGKSFNSPYILGLKPKIEQRNAYNYLYKQNIYNSMGDSFMLKLSSNSFTVYLKGRRYQNSIIFIPAIYKDKQLAVLSGFIFFPLNSNRLYYIVCEQFDSYKQFKSLNSISRIYALNYNLFPAMALSFVDSNLAYVSTMLYQANSNRILGEGIHSPKSRLILDNGVTFKEINSAFEDIFFIGDTGFQLHPKELSYPIWIWGGNLQHTFIERT